MSASPQVRAGATAAALAAIAAITALTLQPRPDVDKRHTAVPFDGGAPVGARCLWVTARASPQAQVLFGLDAGGGTAYVHGYWCALPTDAGIGFVAEAALPAGIDVLRESEWETPHDGGTVQAEFWLQGHSSAGFKCACSSGDTCTWQQPLPDGGSLSRTAPPGVTLEAGTWTGAGCVSKPCVEWAGTSSWPAACPQ